MSLDFEGKVAIVTGSGGGIGKGYALELGKRGAKVVVNDLGGAVDGSGGSLTAAETVVKEIQDNGHPDFFNGVFISIAGGPESQTLKVRSITSSASDQGKIADEFFTGKYKSFNDAIDLSDGFVDEQIQICEQIYKK